MVKSFQMLKILTNSPLFKNSAVGTPGSLALELGVDLVKWLVKVLVSIPDKFKTVIIHLDIADADTPRCEPMKLIRSCGSVLYHSFVFSKYK